MHKSIRVKAELLGKVLMKLGTVPFSTLVNMLLTKWVDDEIKLEI